jgi:enediyne biosynthesis protein E4
VSNGVTAAPRASRWRRQARVSLGYGSAALAVLFIALFLLHPKPRPYTPGHEAAGSEEITQSLSRTLPVDAPKVRFMDVAGESGVRFRHFSGRRTSQLPEDMGSGVAWGDYDGDGDADLFLVNEAGPLTLKPEEVRSSSAKSRLYRNEGNGTFTDVTDAAGVGAEGWGMGAAWGDYDSDFDLDLVVTRYGTNLLYKNRGNGTFQEVSRVAGLEKERGFWTGASWADYDRDGDPDLYVCGYVDYAPNSGLEQKSTRQYNAVVPYSLNPSSYPPERNLLFRNDAGVFHEVAKQAGVDNPTGRSLSGVWGDFDQDGWPDLYVANDISDNAMFRNLGNGRFEDISHSAWVADHRGAMGLGLGDWDNDGDFDIFITHWIAQENALYENQQGRITSGDNEPLHFVDEADMLGLGQIALDFVGWGTDFLDYDNDGRLDLFVANGSTFQKESDTSVLIPMTNQLFWNAGKPRGYFEVGQVAGDSFKLENVGRGAAVADYDQDGDLDIAVGVNGGEARLLRNEGGNRDAWVRVVLRGTKRASPARGMAKLATSSFATGALVRLRSGGASQIRMVGGSSSYLSQSPPGEVWFGVGRADSIEGLEVTWPDGSSQNFTNLPTRSTFHLSEGGEIQSNPLARAEVDRPAGPRQVPEGGSSIAATETAAPSASPTAALPGGPGLGSAGTATLPLSREAVMKFWERFHEAGKLRRAENFPAAVQKFREALAIQGKHEDSLYYLGQCLRETGDFAGAARAWEELVRVNPASARGHLALGAVLASPDEQAPMNLIVAEDHFRRAHAINGEETGPMLRLGEVLIAVGRLPEAQHWLESAAKTNPKSVEAACMAGYARWRSGDLAGAADFYQKASRAAKADVPVKGVLSEGDRKAAPSPGGGKVAAPPLKEPMGKTLFGALCEGLKAQSAGDASTLPVSKESLDRLYRPIQDFATRLARRSAADPPSRAANGIPGAPVPATDKD